MYPLQEDMDIDYIKNYYNFENNCIMTQKQPKTTQNNPKSLI